MFRGYKPSVYANVRCMSALMSVAYISISSVHECFLTYQSGIFHRFTDV